ncbi:MAG: hypothetical protein U7M05_12815, partial [Candidatus Igneacidithiobacillus chanchocoensis]
LGLHGVGECAKKLAAEKAAKFREETSKKAQGMASRRTRYNAAASGLNLNLCNAAKRRWRCCVSATGSPCDGDDAAASLFFFPPSPSRRHGFPPAAKGFSAVTLF